MYASPPFEQGVGPLEMRFGGAAEELEALGGDGGEDPPLVAEVVGRRRMGGPGPAGDLAHAEPAGPDRLDLGQGRLDHRLAQTAAVVGPRRGLGPRHGARVPVPLSERGAVDPCHPAQRRGRPRAPDRERHLSDTAAGLTDALSKFPEVGATVGEADLVGSVRTMTRWHGYFREATGSGWVLVGDAGHFKDPTPGQGSPTPSVRWSSWLRPSPPGWGTGPWIGA